MVVQRLDVVPRVPAIVAAEQRRGLDPGVDRVRCIRRSRLDVPDSRHAEIGTFLELRRGLRGFRLLAGAAAVHGGSPRLAAHRCGGVDRAAISRIERHVIHGAAIIERSLDRPFPPVRRMEEESAFLRPDRDDRTAFLDRTSHVSHPQRWGGCGRRLRDSVSPPPPTPRSVPLSRSVSHTAGVGPPRPRLDPGFPGNSHRARGASRRRSTPRGRLRPARPCTSGAPVGSARAPPRGRSLSEKRRTRCLVPPHLIEGEMKSLWPASANGRRDSEALISSEWLRPTMDTQDILDVALRLASQSEIPADTTINVPARNARRALFGIDVEAADLLMAKEKGYDVVIAHHPTGGSATLDFPKVLVKHADILTRHGVPRAVADAAVREMQEEREPRAHAENYDRLPSIARLIGIGLMCIHNPCDEIGRRVMDETLRAKLKPDPRVRDAIDTLYGIPEFQAAKTRIAVRMGKIDNPLGKWAVHHGAGTNGGVPVARAAFEHGIDTVFYIHIDAGALRRLWELFGREGSKNLVVTGHVASDSIGINALVRELRKRGLRVDTYSGIVDV